MKFEFEHLCEYEYLLAINKNIIMECNNKLLIGFEHFLVYHNYP